MTEPACSCAVFRADNLPPSTDPTSLRQILDDEVYETLVLEATWCLAASEDESRNGEMRQEEQLEA